MASVLVLLFLFLATQGSETKGTPVAREPRHWKLASFPSLSSIGGLFGDDGESRTSKRIEALENTQKRILELLESIAEARVSDPCRRTSESGSTQTTGWKTNVTESTRSPEKVHAGDSENASDASDALSANSVNEQADRKNETRPSTSADQQGSPVSPTRDNEKSEKPDADKETGQSQQQQQLSSNSTERFEDGVASNAIETASDSPEVTGSQMEIATTVGSVSLVDDVSTVSS